MSTVILVDGGFFLRRFPRVYPDLNNSDPNLVATTLFQMATAHLRARDGSRVQLHRILFYDCPPPLKKAHYPISKRAIDFSRTSVAAFRLAFHDALRRQRKMALR